MQFEGKRALVTGGARGIGRCVVAAMLERGMNVGVLDCNAEALQALAREFPKVQTWPCDVTDPVRVVSVVEEFCAHNQRIDILVNNAGLILNSPLVRFTPQGFVKHDIAAWDKAIAVNLSAVFYVSVAVAHKMLAQRAKGVIVNVSSICAQGNAGQCAYSAAKAGVNALTATWAKELAPMGIRVVSVAPGFTETEAMKVSMEEPVRKEWVKQTPLRRMAKPAEIADAILFAISHDFLTGRVLEIDGGLRL